LTFGFEASQVEVELNVEVGSSLYCWEAHLEQVSVAGLTLSVVMVFFYSVVGETHHFLCGGNIRSS
jgi:hypothetical protein